MAVSNLTLEIGGNFQLDPSTAHGSIPFLQESVNKAQCKQPLAARLMNGQGYIATIHRIWQNPDVSGYWSLLIAELGFCLFRSRDQLHYINT